jgi:hypothetical protein
VTARIEPEAITYEPITSGLPWELGAWAQRKPRRFVARDGRDTLLLDGAIHLRFPTLTAACAAVAL